MATIPGGIRTGRRLAGWRGCDSSTRSSSAPPRRSTLLLVNRAIVFGSGEGRWVYPYLQNVTASAVALAVVSALLIPAVFELTARWAGRRAVLTVAVWMAIGFVFQVAVRDLYRIPIGRILESSGCTSFYTVTTLYRPLDLIQRFDSLAPSLALARELQHAGQDLPLLLPGVVLRQSARRSPSACSRSRRSAADWCSPSRTGCSETLASRRWRWCSRWCSRRRSHFYRCPNTVGPIWALASFWLWLVYLDHHRTVTLWLLGASLYLLMFMDPLLFVLGLVFIGMLIVRLLRRELAWRHLWRIAVVPVLGFLLVHVVMRLAVGFDILSVFVTMIRAASEFNERAGRPYGVWIVQNLREFLLGAGLIPSLVFVVTMTALARAAWRAGRAAGLPAAVQALFASSAGALATSVCLCLLAVDLLGVNRGEVTRLWIFLAVFLQLVCAEAIVSRFGGATASLTLAAVAVQTIVTVTTVGFLIC